MQGNSHLAQVPKRRSYKSTVVAKYSLPFWGEASQYIYNTSAAMRTDYDTGVEDLVLTGAAFFLMRRVPRKAQRLQEAGFHEIPKRATGGPRRALGGFRFAAQRRSLYSL